MADIRALAAPLEGKRVLHVNATGFGGGVAEILYSLVPLMNDAGLKADWKFMSARTSSSTSPRRCTTPSRGTRCELTDEDKGSSSGTT